jgi:RHS repeat-associated protein
LNAGLTQVLVSEEATYLYGLARIGEEQPSGWQFYLGDALGSVRQLVDVSNGVGAGMTYEPFGDDLVSTGVANSVYGFTGEWADSYIKLIYLRSRYYQSSFGRFATRDLWSGDIREPTTLHKWMYVADNPINRIDPSGLDPNCPAHRPEYCAWQRLGEIIEGTSGDSFEALFRAFEDRELTERWWLSAGRTSGGRLEWLLRVTRKGLLNIKIPFGDNDCSLNPLFRDQAFYDKEWESWYGGQTSNQVGHFLTAVSSAQWGWTGRRFAIGHEKMSDKPIEGMDSIEHLRRQYQSVTEEDINLWEKAIDADGVGDYDLRDDLLWQILSFEDVARDGVSENRPGNSLQDLRLSLKGFRFNSWIRKIRNYYSQPRRAGIWLRDNLGNWQLTH